MKKDQRITFADARRGIALVLVAVCLVVVFAFVAFTVDVGHMTVMKAELQTAADAAALGSAQDIAAGPAVVRQVAKDIAKKNFAANQELTLEDADIELGFFDFKDKVFVVDEGSANAVKVTAWLRDQNHFFCTSHWP